MAHKKNHVRLSETNRANLGANDSSVHVRNTQIIITLRHDCDAKDYVTFDQMERRM